MAKSTNTKKQTEKQLEQTKGEKEPMQTIQIRIGQKTSGILKDWVGNQDNLNEAAKRALEHFIRIYGSDNINSVEVQMKMAKNLLNALPTGNEKQEPFQETVENVAETAPSVPVSEEKEPESELEEEETPNESKPVKNRDGLSGF